MRNEFAEISVTTNELNYFLADFEQRNESYVLEEAKKDKQSELIEVAKKRGILLNESFDLGVIKLAYVFPDIANDNGDRVPKGELLKRLPTLIGKPLSVDHIRRYTIGYFIDYAYVEKENKVLAYAVVFKDVFRNEWEQFKTLLKKKKLKCSYEIWNDPKKEEKLADGTRILHQLIMAGGTVILDPKEKPAFENCSVLSLAKNFLDNQESRELVYATLNKDVHRCTGDCSNCGLCSEFELITSIQVGERPVQTQAPIPQPTVLKVICSHCGHNFEHQFTLGTTNEIKCPNCFSILDTSGKVVYPPQLRDFNLSCEKCQARDNWLIISKNEEEKTAKIKCKNCAQEYQIKYKEYGVSIKYVKMLNFVKYVGVRCIQCGHLNERHIPSSQKVLDIKCSKCEMKFSFDTEHKSVRRLEKVEAISVKEEKKVDNLVKATLIKEIEGLLGEEVTLASIKDDSEKDNLIKEVNELLIQ